MRDSIPSVDTGVCTASGRRWNASALGCFDGQVVDRFGVHWLIGLEGEA